MFRSKQAVKLCVASRPYQTFRSEFADARTRSLAIQDLTRQDINNYVQSTMSASKAFRELGTDSMKYQELVNEIIEAAEGVFLWVHLACQSLLRGISHQDRMHDLQERLRQLPCDLSDLYKHILTQIPQEYQKTAARSLLMATMSTRLDTAPLLANVYLDDHDRDILDTLSQLDLNAAREDCARARNRIIAHCRGLLEVCNQDRSRSGNAAVSSINFAFLRVRFPHRTMADFIQSEQNRETLLAWASFSNTAYARFVQAIISSLKALFLIANSLASPLRDADGEDPLPDVLCLSFRVCVQLIVYHNHMYWDASRTREQGFKECLRMALWDELRAVACLPLQHYSIAWTISASRSSLLIKDHSIWNFTEHGQYAGLSLAVCLGWKEVIRNELQRLDTPIDVMHDQPAIDFTLKVKEFDMLCTFVELGLDVERVYEPAGQSLWHAVLQESYAIPCWLHRNSSSIRDHVRKLITLMTVKTTELDATFSFGFVTKRLRDQDGDLDGTRAEIIVLPVRRKTRKADGDIPPADLTQLHCSSTETNSPNEDQAKSAESASQWEVDWSKSFRKEFEVTIVEVVQFTTMEIVRNVFTVRFGLGGQDAATAGDIEPIPSVISSLLPSIAVVGEKETPGQAMLRLHGSRCAECRGKKPIIIPLLITAVLLFR